MDQTKSVYIALGSNTGDKFQYLQLAVNEIHQKIGAIQIISKVFSSPAFGFEGDDFFNACLLVNTNLKPKKVLSLLLAIEKDLGRLPSVKDIYESRCIDLDIIFFNDQIIQTENVTIPHPQMQKRNFVLTPLKEIAPNFIHPILKKSITQLLTDCEDPLLCIKK